ncbi:MAG TPA: hypothetical protein VLE22_14060 [Bryobacteraceae bacterium]|nr:hypothetical protein [Bryobacteraceae bacterium]
MATPVDQRHPAEVARERLEFHTFIAPDHVERTLIGGVEWRKEFTDVRLHITNHNDFDLENVDFLVRFDTEVAKAAQLSEIPDVNLLAISGDPPGLVYSSLKYKDASGKEVEEEPAFRAIAVPAYRVLCKRLLRGHPLQIVFATAALETEEKDGVSLTAIDRFAYPRKRPTTMQISGVYEGTNTDGKHIHRDIGTGTFKY